MATTSSTWMNPESVYEVTIPSAHMITNNIAIVQSITDSFFLHSNTERNTYRRTISV